MLSKRVCRMVALARNVSGGIRMRQHCPRHARRLNPQNCRILRTSFEQLEAEKTSFCGEKFLRFQSFKNFKKFKITLKVLVFYSVQKTGHRIKDTRKTSDILYVIIHA